MADNTHVLVEKDGHYYLAEADIRNGEKVLKLNAEWKKGDIFWPDNHGPARPDGSRGGWVHFSRILDPALMSDAEKNSVKYHYPASRSPAAPARQNPTPLPGLSRHTEELRDYVNRVKLQQDEYERQLRNGLVRQPPPLPPFANPQRPVAGSVAANTSSWTDSRAENAAENYRRLGNSHSTPSAQIYPGVAVTVNGEPPPGTGSPGNAQATARGSGNTSPLLNRIARTLAAGNAQARQPQQPQPQPSPQPQTQFVSFSSPQPPPNENKGVLGWLLTGATALLSFIAASSFTGPVLGLLIAGALAVGAYYLYQHFTQKPSVAPAPGMTTASRSPEASTAIVRQQEKPNPGQLPPAPPNRGRIQPQRG